MDTSFSMVCVSGLILMAIGLLFARPLLVLFGASREALVYACPYLMIYLIGTLPSMIAVGMNPFINAQGYSTVGMLSVAIGAVANLLLDPLFIFVLGFGVSGSSHRDGALPVSFRRVCPVFPYEKVRVEGPFSPEK